MAQQDAIVAVADEVFLNAENRKEKQYSLYRIVISARKKKKKDGCKGLTFNSGHDDLQHRSVSSSGDTEKG